MQWRHLTRRTCVAVQLVGIRAQNGTGPFSHTISQGNTQIEAYVIVRSCAVECIAN
jgi:hypothetical protein